MGGINPRGGATTADLVAAVQRRLAESDGADAGQMRTAELIREEAGVISDSEVLHVLRALRSESTGAGILEPLLSTPGVTDVLVNGPDSVWVDGGAGLRKTAVRFADNAAVRRLATRLAASSGRRLDDAQPFASGRVMLADGTWARLHAVLSPPADSGTLISLRVLRQAQLTLANLQAYGAIDATGAAVLQAIVHARDSFLVVGGTGTGKTTVLSALLAEVNPAERIVSIEDTPELNPWHPHMVSLVTKEANAEGKGAISMRELVAQSLRMRPDRIVVGEIRGAEIVELMAALNTGHDGGAGTLHANSVSDVLARVEALAALGGLAPQAAHTQFAAAIKAVIAVGRHGGRRVVHSIGKVSPGPLRIETLWDREGGCTPLLASTYPHCVQAMEGRTP